MARSRTLRKRCEKCGWVGAVKPRVRRCKQPAGLMGQFACWGLLVAAPIVRKTEPAQHDDRLERKLADAHIKLDEQIRRLNLVTRNIKKHHRTVRRLESRIAERDKALRPVPNRTARVVTLDPEVGHG